MDWTWTDLSIQKKESTPNVKGIQSGGHRIDGIAGALEKRAIEVQEVDRYGHPNLVRSGGK